MKRPMPSYQKASEYILRINLGAGFDIVTGNYVIGRRGESILNGGLSQITGIVAIGNQFKSTLGDWMGATACERCPESTGLDYDSELNKEESRLRRLAQHIADRHYHYCNAPEENIYEGDLFDRERWMLTTKREYSGDEWYEKRKAFLEDKAKDKSYLVDTPFWNREREGAFRVPVPTFTVMDSLTEFDTADVVKQQASNELGESGGNTIQLRQGLAKFRFLQEAPHLNAKGNDYLIMMAQIGKEGTMMNAGPGGQQPVITLKYLTNGDKMMGVTKKFSYITHNIWHCFNAAPLLAPDNSGPMYPLENDPKRKYDSDLQLVKVRNLRGKSGGTGMPLLVIISQRDGVQPSLTEYHNIKLKGYFGLKGSQQNHASCFYPKVNITRTTVRTLINQDPLLRRALNITHELQQIIEDMPHLEEFFCTPEELYEDLKNMGYDWDELLRTREWWTYAEDGLLPYLSTMDLLRMRKGLYHPYWMEPLTKAAPAAEAPKTPASKKNSHEKEAANV